MQSKILFVDDDPNLLSAFKRNFRKQFAFDIALGGQEALELLKSSGPYAVILADMNMPGMNGVELLERVRKRAPNTVRLMLTGNADQKTAMEAVNRGSVFRFLNKPCPPEELVPALQEGIKEFERAQIEREVLEGTLTGCIKMLASVLGMVAPEALGRGQKLRGSMTSLAKHLNIHPVWECDLAALLANVGYALVPASIHRKLTLEVELTDEEREILRRTPKIGHDLLIGIPRLSRVAKAIYYQKAHFGGGGFPGDGVKGEDLPVISRLLKILNDRLDLEQDGVVKEHAFSAMQQRTGLYDPQLLQASFVHSGSFMANMISADKPVISLTAIHLEPGDIAVSDITGKGGLSIVSAGTQLEAAVIERIQNFARIGQVSEPILVQRAVKA